MLFGCKDEICIYIVDHNTPALIIEARILHYNYIYVCNAASIGKKY